MKNGTSMTTYHMKKISLRDYVTNRDANKDITQEAWKYVRNNQQNNQRVHHTDTE